MNKMPKDFFQVVIQIYANENKPVIAISEKSDSPATVRNFFNEMELSIDTKKKYNICIGKILKEYKLEVDKCAAMVEKALNEARIQEKARADKNESIIKSQDDKIKSQDDKIKSQEEKTKSQEVKFENRISSLINSFKKILENNKIEFNQKDFEEIEL